jgi:PAS domain-containing protein
MQFAYSPYVVPLALAALVSAVITVYAWTRRGMRGAIGLVALGMGAALWSLGYALEIAGADLPTKLFWGKFQYLGIVTIPLAWLVFAFVYAELEKRLSQQMVLTLGFIPLVTLILAFTTETHGLIWKDYSIYRSGMFSALQITHGPWFWVYWVFSQIAILIGMVVLVRAFLSARGAFRGRVILVFVAVFAPWVANVISITNILPVPMDLTPFAFTISVAVMAWAIFRMRLVDIVPIARDLVLESMQDGVIVLDMRGNVVDINVTAARMIGVPAMQAIGKPALDVFFPWPHLIERFRSTMDADEEIVVGSGSAQLRYHVRFSPLIDPADQPVGRVIMLHSVGDTIPLLRSMVSDGKTQPPVQDEASGFEEDERGLQVKNPIGAALVGFFYPSIKVIFLFQRAPIQFGMRRVNGFLQLGSGLPHCWVSWRTLWPRLMVSLKMQSCSL